MVCLDSVSFSSVTEMNKIHTLQNTERPILFSGSNMFAWLDWIHSLTDCFLFYSPMLACQNTDVFSDVFPIDHIWNLPLILTLADKDLLRAWQAKWVVTSSCSICNSADGIFEVFLAVCNSGAQRSSKLHITNKKLVFEILKCAILIGKYTLRPLYHAEPASKRTLPASQIR